MVCDTTSTISYSMFFKAILKFLVFLETNLNFNLDILDYVPRNLTILYLEIVDSIHKQVEGCLQNFLLIGSYSPEVRSFGKYLVL